MSLYVHVHVYTVLAWNCSCWRSICHSTLSFLLPRTSRSRKHRNRSASRSPSPKPLNPNERTSSSSKRKSKHSKKHRRHRHKSRSPSPEQSPIATDDVKQEPYQSDDSGDSPPPDRVDSERGSEGESSDVEGRASPNGEREVDVDTDSSYD